MSFCSPELRSDLTRDKCKLRRADHQLISVDRNCLATNAPSGRVPRYLLISLSVTVSLTLVSWLYAMVNHLRGLPKPYSWPYCCARLPADTSRDRFANLVKSTDRLHHFGNADFCRCMKPRFFARHRWRFAIGSFSHHFPIQYVGLPLSA